MNKRIALKTIGCKLNFAETSTISREFTNRGFEIVDFNSKADVYIVNTCTVTANADKDCRKAVHQANRNNPNAFVAMVGCFSQLHSEEANGIPGVSAVLGNDEKFNVFSHYQAFNNNTNEFEYHGQTNSLNDFHASHSTSERTRVFLKVQDGCDYECTYCTIPLARGKSRSDTIESTMQQAKEIAKTSTREIVLTGINTGDFGKGTNEDFFDLIRELDTLDNIDRIRISSIEPNLLTAEMIDFIADSKLFVPHFHIPLQSGSNKILKDMRRRYQHELFAEKVKKIKSTIPDCCIGVDVIVGFPTETEKDFQETYDFLKNLDISYLHVFSYSPRDNTKALDLKNIVSYAQRKERSKILRKLSDSKQNTFYNKFTGLERKVLFESYSNGKAQGHTDNYIKVIVQGNAEMVNKIISVKLVRNETEYVVGEVLD
ncbi:MAG: tRNA (N(6)-L-threonylcarbamoyladenosine(37)-C(2))-methylthiotransferase MtaB [Planctomycetia bacterium]|nr:tRNA (N(6)-L-threonylcarbamoyladenosine(37)-C(2))-methylthiotransferase MtaB [Planctomycetia bacterium]